MQLSNALTRLIDVALAIIAIEFVLVSLLKFSVLQTREVISYAGTCVAGAALLVTLRGALNGVESAWLILGLTIAGLAHAADVVYRLAA